MQMNLRAALNSKTKVLQSVCESYPYILIFLVLFIQSLLPDNICQRPFWMNRKTEDFVANPNL